MSVWGTCECLSVVSLIDLAEYQQRKQYYADVRYVPLRLLMWPLCTPVIFLTAQIQNR